MVLPKLTMLECDVRIYVLTMIYCLGCLAPLLIPMIVHLGMTVAVECQRDTPVLQDWLLNSEIIFAFGQIKYRPAMLLRIRPGLRFPVQEP